jgi:hypothetical protein
MGIENIDQLIFSQCDPIRSCWNIIRICKINFSFLYENMTVLFSYDFSCRTAAQSALFVCSIIQCSRQQTERLQSRSIIGWRLIFYDDVSRSRSILLVRYQYVLDCQLHDLSACYYRFSCVNMLVYSPRQLTRQEMKDDDYPPTLLSCCLSQRLKTCSRHIRQTNAKLS